MARVLDGLEPARVFYHFEELSKIPRASRNEKAVSDYLVDFADKCGYPAVQDDSYNVVVNIPATPGYETRKKLAMQAHIDMVCQKVEGSAFDFEKDPLELYIENGFVRAKDTTLGADDGFGVALLMAVMEADDIPHPSLQMIFTSGEEVMFTGALAMDGKLIESDYFIGLDCSRDDIIMVSCAGISVNHIEMVSRRCPAAGEKTAFTIEIDGLQSGHSGYMIHKGYANAIKLMGDIISDLRQSIDCEVSSFTSNSLINVIPKDAKAVVCCERQQAAELESALDAAIQKAKAAFRRTEPGMTITVEKGELQEGATCLDADVLQTFLDALRILPSGAYSMMDDAFTVAECSSNVGAVKEADGKLTVTVSIRSNSEYQHDNLQRMIATMARCLGAEFVVENRAHSWEYNPDSVLMKEVARLYRELNGSEPEIKIIHASVEGGVFIEKAEQQGRRLDLINIGCNNFDVHTPNERLQIASVGKTYQLLKNIMKEL